MKKKNIFIIGIVTAVILSIPLIAMQFTEEVRWGLMDFVIMGTLLFGTGLAYEFISSRSSNSAYKAAVGIAVIAGLLLVWISLAVGIIGSEGNPANLLYVGVLLIGIIGSLATSVRPKGMTYTLFLMAFAQLIIPVIALIFWRPALDEPPGIVGVFGLNAFFALLFSVSALLFKKASSSDLKGNSAPNVQTQ